MTEPLRPPTRLRDDPNASSALRSGLDELHQHDVSYDVDAGEKRLLAAIAIGAGVATAASASATAASAATGSAAGATASGASTLATATGVSLATKVTLALAVTSASAVGVYSVGDFGRGGASLPPTQPPPMSTAAHVVEAPPRAPLELTPPRAEPHAAQPPAALPPTALPPTALPPTALPPASMPTDEAAPVDPSLRAPEPNKSALAARPSVEEETRHLAELRRLESSDPARAVRMADEGHTRFARGVFWQEREAIAIFALRRLGRTADADRRATAFVERHPNSPFVEALKAR